MIPLARIAHQMSDRVRFRIPSRRGDTDYFQETARRIAEAIEPDRVEANPATGSLLVLDRRLDLGALLLTAQDNGLFRVNGAADSVSLAHLVVSPIKSVSDRLRQATLGQIDLPNLAFFALVGIGTYQLIRGGLRSPPWYTAFWYAMGIYLKTLADKTVVKPPGA